MKLFTTAALALLISAGTSHAATFDFGLLADEIGEGNWGSQASNGDVAGGAWDGTSYTVDGISVQAFGGQYDSTGIASPERTFAYLDGSTDARQGGLGTCSELSGTQCAASNDDNTGISGGVDSTSNFFETITLFFNEAVSISGLILRDDDHVELLPNDMIGFNAGPGFSFANYIVGSTDLSTTFSNIWIFAKVPNGEDFYIDGVTVSPVPLPAAGLLLLGGLGGLAAMRRRKKAA